METMMKQLFAWDNTYNDRAWTALRLALRHKSDLHAHRMEHIRATIEERVFHARFPPELRIKVAEAMVSVQRLHWRLDAEASLQSAADGEFAWPDNIGQDTRVQLRQMTEVPLFTHATIELSAKVLYPRNDPPLAIPKVLAGNEHCVRYLVLDIEVLLQSDGEAADDYVMRANRGMEVLTQHFPTLKTCIISILFRDPHAHASHNSMLDTETISRHIDFFRRRIEKCGPHTAKLIETFGEKRPGKRKYVQFAYETDRQAHAGSLIEVVHCNKPEVPADMSMSIKPEPYGYCIFAQAYTGCRSIDVRKRQKATRKASAYR